MKRFFGAIAVASLMFGGIVDAAASGLPRADEAVSGAGAPAPKAGVRPVQGPATGAFLARAVVDMTTTDGVADARVTMALARAGIPTTAAGDGTWSITGTAVEDRSAGDPGVPEALADWQPMALVGGAEAPVVEIPQFLAGDHAGSGTPSPTEPDAVEALHFAGVAGGEGIRAIGADAWQDAGYRGAGTVVAVIDTGFGDWARAVAAGDVPEVPESRRVNFCDRGFDAKNHGTGTSEIVHDIAPDADLALICIDDAADLARAVGFLPDLGVDIVNMSLGFYNTARGDGSGGPGTPDDSVRRTLAAGISWVNSAGNEAPYHWSGDFTDDDGDGFGTFAPGAELGALTVAARASLELHLRWDEWPLRDDGDRFQLCFTVDPARAPSCRATPEVKGTPTLGLALTNPRADAVTLYLSVQRLSGTGRPALDLFLKGATDWQYPVPDGSLLEPASVPGVVSVGATCTDTGIIQPYSSRGSTVDGRAGISLAAPGAVSGLLFGPVSACRGGYGGTSAAAPHAAGALALLRQLDPQAPGPHLVEELLTRTAAAGDPGAPGVDPVYGHGRLYLGSPPPFGPDSLPASGAALGVGLATSPSDTRTPATPLAGDEVQGDLFAFLTPTYPAAPVAVVRFYVDGVLVQVERQAGYDLGGGRWDRAYPFDTFRLVDGRHRLDAVVTLVDGRDVAVGTTFVVTNGDAPRPTPSGVLRRGLAPLDGTVLDGAFLEAAVPGGEQPDRVVLDLAVDLGEVRYVVFYVDAVLVAYDEWPTYDLDTLALIALDPGQHMVQAIAELADGTTRTANASFRVRAG